LRFLCKGLKGFGKLGVEAALEQIVEVRHQADDCLMSPLLRNRSGQVMSKDDWYRNKDWNTQIMSEFDAKLKRARDKSQYLRIQASYLTKIHPQAALNLLDRYFDLGEHFDFAQAYVDQAKAYLTLGNISETIISFEKALVREKNYPKLLTNAYLDLPLIIAVKGIESKYDEALETLDEYRSRLTFSIDRYKWNAAKSIILSSLDYHKKAANFAQSAIEASAEKQSGIRYHPKIGLFSESKMDKQIYKNVKKIAARIN